MSYCMKCGSPMKDNEKFCGNCGCSPAQFTQQVQQTQQPQIVYVVAPEQEKPLSLGYKVISYFFMFAFLSLGIYALCSGNIESNEGLGIYKSIILCLTAFVFHPKVKVSSGSPFLSFGAKFFVAIGLLLFL